MATAGRSSAGSRAVGLPPRSLKASEFKAKCLELMDEVQQRQIEVVVTKRGRPVAKLVPVNETPESPFGFMRGTVLSGGDVVAPNDEEWEPGDDPLDER